MSERPRANHQWDAIHSIATYQCCHAVRITSRSYSCGNAVNISRAERKAPTFGVAIGSSVMLRAVIRSDANQRACLNHRQNQNRSQPYPSVRTALRARPQWVRRIRFELGLIVAAERTYPVRATRPCGLNAWTRFLSSAPFRTTIFHNLHIRTCMYVYI